MEFLKKYWIELMGVLILFSSLITYLPKIDSGYKSVLLIVLFIVFSGVVFLYRYRLERKKIAQIGKEERDYLRAVDKLKNISDESGKNI